MLSLIILVVVVVVVLSSLSLSVEVVVVPVAGHHLVQEDGPPRPASHEREHGVGEGACRKFERNTTNSLKRNPNKKHKNKKYEKRRHQDQGA